MPSMGQPAFVSRGGASVDRPGTEDDVIEISSDEEDLARSNSRTDAPCRSVSREDSVISLTSGSEDEHAPRAPATVVKEERRTPSVIVISDSDSELGSSHKENADAASPDRSCVSGEARTSVIVVDKHGRLSLRSVPSTPSRAHVHGLPTAADVPTTPAIGHSVRIATTTTDTGRAAAHVVNGERAAADQYDHSEDDGAGSDWEVPSASRSPPFLIAADLVFPGVFSYEVWPSVREPAQGSLQRFDIRGHWQVKLAIYFRVSVRVTPCGALVLTDNMWTQKEMPPVFKMITVEDPSGKLFLNNYWITRRLFEHVGVQEFRIWDRELTDWKVHKLIDPIPYSITFNHMILIRLPGVALLHGWAGMIAQTYAPCTTVDYTRVIGGPDEAVDPYTGGVDYKGKKPAFN